MTIQAENEKPAIVGVVVVGLIIPLGGLIAATLLNLTIFRDNRAAQRKVLAVGVAVTLVELIIFGLALWGLQPQ